MTPAILETMKQALESLELSRPAYVQECHDRHNNAITNLKAAIKAMEDVEPVKCRYCGQDTMHMGDVCYSCNNSAPAVPEERNRDLDEFNEVGQAYDQGWNDCRKAMLAAAPEYNHEQ